MPDRVAAEGGEACVDSASEFIADAGEDTLDFHTFDPRRPRLRSVDLAARPPLHLHAAVGGRQPLEALGSDGFRSLAVNLPLPVQEILYHRREEEEKRRQDFDALPTPGSASAALALVRDPWRLAPESDTEKMRLFCSSVRLLQDEQRKHSICHHLELRTFINLSGYNIDSIAEKRRHNPGSLQLIYMFYSRIYEKLVGKQRGVDINLFDPMDLEARNLGFRAILDFASDFKLFHGKVGRRELERIYCTVHAGAMPPLERFASKITFAEFVRLVALIDCGGEPMDRSKLDGSQTRCNESRLERTKRLCQFLSLTSVKKIKFLLHDLYRDVHFWKLSDGADFDKEARSAELRSRPQWKVQPLRELTPSEQAKENAICKYLTEKFTWVKVDQVWEEFEGPFLDMGALVVGGPSSFFRVKLTNRGLSLAWLQLEVTSGGPMRLPWRDKPLGPGQSTEVPVEFMPLDCGEWCGEIVVKAAWSGRSHEHEGAHEEMHIPTYMRVLHPHPGAAELAAQLPVLVSRPFRPGSTCRLILDPTSLCSRQLRTPTPGASRSSSAVPTAAATPLPGPTETPLGMFSGRALSSGTTSARPPRSSSRGSSSRPGSGGLRGAHLAKEMRQGRSASCCTPMHHHPDISAAEHCAGSRPHSAPFACHSAFRPGSACRIAAGTAVATTGDAAAARPASATVRPTLGMPSPVAVAVATMPRGLDRLLGTT